MEPKDFVRILLRRKRTVLTAIVIVMLTAFLGSLRKAPQYFAQCEVLFGVVLSDPTDPTSQAIETIGDQTDNVHFLTSPVIAAAAAKKLPGVTAPEIQGKVHAELVEGTNQYFRLQVADGEPPGTRAARICNEVANSYVQYKQQVAREFFARALEQNQRSYVATLADYDDNQRKLESAEQANDRSQILALTIEQNTLLQTISELKEKSRAFKNQVQNGVEGGPKLTSPSGGGAATGADKKRDLMLGLIVGLMFGVGIALVREYLDDTVKDKESAQRELGLPVLANFPAADGPDGFVESSSSALESARTLRATLSSLGFPHDKRMLVVASTLSKSRSTTLVNLAAAVAESGRTVLVIGSDLRGGRTHEGFGIANTVGLANVVRGQVAFEKAIRPAPGMDGVYVLPCGPVIGNPGELLSSEEMAFTLGKARRWADVVLLDAPPVLAAADASILGAFSDGVVLVLASGATNRAQANEAKEQLVAAGARVLGAVLIGSDDSSQRQANGGFDDDLPPVMPYGEWGGYGGGQGYDDWYGEDVFTTTARTVPRKPGARRAPNKKTAASKPTAPARVASVPRRRPAESGVVKPVPRTLSGSRPGARTPAAKRPSGSKGATRPTTARTASGASRPAREPSTRARKASAPTGSARTASARTASARKTTSTSKRSSAAQRSGTRRR